LSANLYVFLLQSSRVGAPPASSHDIFGQQFFPEFISTTKFCSSSGSNARPTRPTSLEINNVHSGNNESSSPGGRVFLVVLMTRRCGANYATHNEQKAERASQLCLNPEQRMMMDAARKEQQTVHDPHF